MPRKVHFGDVTGVEICSNRLNPIFPQYSERVEPQEAAGTTPGAIRQIFRHDPAFNPFMVSSLAPKPCYFMVSSLAPDFCHFMVSSLAPVSGYFMVSSLAPKPCYFMVSSRA